ncbi:MAG: hypothetical protein V3S01_01015 [Dehalococcoidia bacterium]
MTRRRYVLGIDGGYRRQDDIGAFRGIIWCSAIVLGISLAFCFVADGPREARGVLLEEHLTELPSPGVASFESWAGEFVSTQAGATQ